MSSDYISRLRAELLRAGAAERTPLRRARTVRRLRPLAAALAIALVVATVVLIAPRERSDDISSQPPHSTVTRTHETFTLTYRVPTGDPAQVAQVLRGRVQAAGLDAEVTAGPRSLTITAPTSARAELATLTAPGRFAIYDWERSVLGLDSRPTLGELTESEARSRASETRGARAIDASAGAGVGAGVGLGWLVLGGDPALTNADVASARAGHDTTGPNVIIDLTPAGQRTFATLTRGSARRSAGTGDSSQHLAFVIDDRLVAMPPVNSREAPDGIDGAKGVSLPGLQTPDQARLTAALLSAGPLQDTLELVGG